jgi:hypothetical protein
MLSPFLDINAATDIGSYLRARRGFFLSRETQEESEYLKKDGIMCLVRKVFEMVSFSDVLFEL